jgi:outer membrane immunogenic protein
MKAPPLPVAAIYNWSGFYVGANAGWGGDRKCWSLINDAGVPVVPAFNLGCNDGSGGVAGGQIGYRWQSGAFVFGAEAQGDWANLTGSNVSLRTALVVNQSKVNAFGLFTGQLGYAWNSVLLYVKGGAAVTSDKYNGIAAASGVVFDQASETRWGGTVGVGAEYGFAANWSVALEYDHLFMGRTNNNFFSTGTDPAGITNIPAGGLVRGVSIGQDVDLVTVRINYRFGGPVVARY